MKRLAWIEDYLTGELSPEQEREFNDLLQEDVALQHELALVKDIDSALQESEILDLRMTLRDISISESVVEKESSTRSIPIYRSRRWLLRVAAAVLFLAVSSAVYFLRPEPNPDQIFSQYFEAYPSMYNVRSSDQPVELQEVIAAMQPYVDGDYATAATNLESLLARDASRADLSFYFGICQIQLHNPELAVASFDKVIASNHELLINHAKWYKSLALLEAKQYTEAKQGFAELAQGESSFKDRASKIERKLRRIGED